MKTVLGSWRGWGAAFKVTQRQPRSWQLSDDKAPDQLPRVLNDCLEAPGEIPPRPWEATLFSCNSRAPPPPCRWGATPRASKEAELLLISQWQRCTILPEHPPAATFKYLEYFLLGLISPHLLEYFCWILWIYVMHQSSKESIQSIKMSWMNHPSITLSTGSSASHMCSMESESRGQLLYTVDLKSEQLKLNPGVKGLNWSSSAGFTLKHFLLHRPCASHPSAG